MKSQGVALRAMENLPPVPVFFGELLVDILLDRDRSASYHPGGAPANAAATVAAMGLKPYLVATVGGDRFGEWLKRVVVAEGIDVAALEVLADQKTSLAMAYPDGGTAERFTFYRDADLCISDQQVKRIDVRRVAILCYGSPSLIGVPALAHALSAIKRSVHIAGGLVMCDINFRRSMWGNEREFTTVIRQDLATADIVKANTVEAGLIVGSRSPAVMAADLLALGPRLAIVTAGPDGTYARAKDVSIHIPVGKRFEGEGFVGTGDAIAGCLAAHVCLSGAANLLDAEWLESVLIEGTRQAEETLLLGRANWRSVVSL